MAYTKTNWVNGSAPALSAENMNKIEQGIYDNDARIAAVLAAMTGWSLTRYDVSNGGAVTIPIQSASRGLFFMASYSTNKTAIYAVGANSSGTTGNSLIVASTGGSGFTLTNGTNEITVANSAGSMAAVFYLTTT